jgi:BCD family chlorophyll transporter-like MFS transporter
MMILGFALTATVAGRFLDPYSGQRLVGVTSVVCVMAFVVAWLAMLGLEAKSAPAIAESREPHPPFRAALGQVWREPQARRFAIFVFVSMIAYSMQDLILEPFAGAIFGFTPGESTKLAGLQHAGVFCGMVCVAVAASGLGIGRRSLLTWVVGGCLASALALGGLAAAAATAPAWPLRASVFALGFANGAYAVAAIGAMMQFVSQGRQAREGVRMGIWGAAQAIAFALGGLVGAGAVDLARQVFDSTAAAYGTVFAVEGLLFVVSAVLALRIARQAPRPAGRPAANGDYVVSNAGA